MQAKSFAGLVINQSSNQSFIGPDTVEVQYTITVANTGTASLSNVQVTAPGCEQVAYQSGDNGNGQLDQGETWTYTAIDNTFDYVPGSTLSCIASVTATSGTEAVSASASGALPIIGFNLEKQASIEKGCVGDEVQFTLITRLYAPPNSGITLELIELIDDTCSPLETTGGDTNEFGRLALPPGEGVAELFNVCTLILSESITNTATETVRFYASDGTPDSRTFMESDSASVIVDTVAPEITSCPPNVTVAASESKDPSNTGSPTISDECDPEPTFTFRDAPPEGGCPMTIERTWIASDNCGNTNTCTQTITMECPVDFGDAPDSNTDVQAGVPNGYPTTIADDGARHIVTTTLFLGSIIDDEADGQPDPIAEGDDNSDTSDEDGVTFSSLNPGGDGTATVTVTGDNGILNAWFDFNRDGDWDDPGEQIATDLPVVNGVNVIMFPVPADASPGPTFTRVRLSTETGLTPTGEAPNGEVEDYVVTILTPNATVTALVYCDHNDDGIIEEDAIFFNNVTVQLIRNGEVVDETTTGANGMVSFGTVPLGPHTVQVVDGEGTPLEGKVIAPANYDNPVEINIDNPDGTADTTFGYMSAMAPPLAIDGYVWIDVNNNQIADEVLNDTEFNDVTMKLIKDGEVIATVQTGIEPNTANNGYFIFADLEPGDYSVMGTFTNPGNMKDVTLISDCMGTRVLFPVRGKLTAVELAALEGLVTPDGIQINWTTGVEENNLGFFIYRSTDDGFDHAQQIGAFITGAGNASDVDYSYVDTTAAPYTLYYYWLVDVDTELTMTPHGPVEIYNAPYKTPAFQLCGIYLRDIIKAGVRVRRGEKADLLINGSPASWRLYKPYGNATGVLFNAPAGIHDFNVTITVGDRVYPIPDHAVVHVK